MEPIIKLAIEGGYKYHEWEQLTIDQQNSSRWLAYNIEGQTFHPVNEHDFVLDSRFWEALGKVSGWDKSERYWSMQNDEGAVTLLDAWENNAVTFHYINLTEGWDKAVAYLLTQVPTRGTALVN